MSLGKKFALSVILASTLLSSIVTVFQLYTNFHRDKRSLIDAVDNINKAFKSTFVDALREYNYEILETLLDGDYSSPDVVYIALKTSEGRVFQRGNEIPKENYETQIYDFFYDQNGRGKQKIVSMQIYISLDNIHSEVLSLLWTLLLSNFLKTTLGAVDNSHR